MKYLRAYEAYIDEEELEPNFKVGDTVVSVENFQLGSIDDFLIKGERYIITNIEQTKIDKISGGWRCTVKGKNRRYYCSRFCTELEYNTNKYNI